MKWFIVAEHDLSINNAISTHVIELCKSLSRTENVTLLSFTPTSDTLLNVNFNSQTINQVKVFSDNISVIINTIRVFFYLMKQKRNIDILYIRASGLSIGPILFSMLTKSFSILEINGIWLDEQKISRSKLPTTKRLCVVPVHFVRHASLLFMAKNAHLIVAVTPQIRSFLEKFGIKGETIHVIHNGVNTTHFYPRDITNAKEKINLDQNIDYFGYVGSTSSWQGLEDLIDSLGLIKDKIHYKLVIIGNGSGLGSLKELVKKNELDNHVYFLGSQPHGLIPEFISACRFMVAPKKELQSGYSPLKVYEYLASGRPLIAPDIPGLSFIATNGLGLTYKANDINALSKCILKMQNLTDDEWIQISKNARDIAVKEFSWDIAANHICKIAYDHFQP